MNNDLKVVACVGLASTSAAMFAVMMSTGLRNNSGTKLSIVSVMGAVGAAIGARFAYRGPLIC